MVGRAGSATVVVVDDNEANLGLVARVLATRPEIRTSYARDGVAGLELVAAELPDLVLLDLHLPRMDGGEVLRRLKADPSTARVPVVVLSGDADADTMRRTRDDGAAVYLAKPFDIRRLVEIVDELVFAIDDASTEPPSGPQR